MHFYEPGYMCRGHTHAGSFLSLRHSFFRVQNGANVTGDRHRDVRPARHKNHFSYRFDSIDIKFNDAHRVRTVYRFLYFLSLSQNCDSVS